MHGPSSRSNALTSSAVYICLCVQEKEGGEESILNALWKMYSADILNYSNKVTIIANSMA